MQLNLTKERDAFLSQIAAAITTFTKSAASKFGDRRAFPSRPGERPPRRPAG
jgi:hypothetical protein